MPTDVGATTRPRQEILWSPVCGIFSSSLVQVIPVINPSNYITGLVPPTPLGISLTPSASQTKLIVQQGKVC